MAESDNDRQNDPHVLRAKDVVPPYDSDIVAGKGGKVERDDTVQRSSKIPSFDLANDIMAEQRKITAQRRRGPGMESSLKGWEEQPVEKASAGSQRYEPAPELQKIVADIVARDIEELFRAGR